MGAYCHEKGLFRKAMVGEELHIAKIGRAKVVVGADGGAVCTSHEGGTLQVLSVAPALARHPVLKNLTEGQTVHYAVENAFHQGERDLVTTKNGETVDLMELQGCTFTIVEERPATEGGDG